MIRPRLARLNADGSTDMDFDVGSGPDQAVNSVVVLTTGTVVAGGDFDAVDGTARPGLAVLDSTGVLVDTDIAAGDGNVHALSLQADGKTIVGGDFLTIGGSEHVRLGRINSVFEVEPSFTPSATAFPVYALANQEDGKILVGGAFSTINGVARSGMARLYNDVPIDTLSVISVSEVFWERAGSSPELEYVNFYVIAPGDPDWTLLGPGVRDAGGWRITGLTLPSEGDVEVRGFPHSTSSQGAVVQGVPFEIAPEIQVEQPAGTILVDASSTVTFPTTQTGGEQILTFTIRNIGKDDLELDSPTPVTLATGTSYSIVAQPSPLTITPGSSVTFQVRFYPTTAGTKNDTLSIGSDDTDEDPFTVALTGVATPGPGSRDTTFQPVFNGTVGTTAEDPLNRILFGGSFTSLNSSVRNRIARILSSGLVDSTLSPSFSNSVTCVAVQEDGMIVVGGAFTQKNGVTRNRIARMTDTGALDTSFNPNANGIVWSLDINAAGQILVSGEFTRIGGVDCTGVAVLSPTGSVVRAITGVPLSGGTPRVARFQSDGKIVVAAYTNVYRFLSTGVQDFATPVGGAGSYALALQSDGKILVGGSFTTLGGEAKLRYGRINADGTVDTGFTCDANNSVNGICAQADGTAVVGGFFTTFGGGTSARAARSLAAGGEDDTFVSAITAGNVTGVSILEDGKPVINGSFTIEGAAVTVARLSNGAATESLSVLSPTSVQWLRGGTAPEASYVVFDVSQDSGATWFRLGTGTRVEGGWELTGTNVPSSGTLRGTARIPSDASSGLVQSSINFSGVLSPDIRLEQPTNVPVADDGSKEFPGLLVGQSTTLTFTIRNTGLATLSGISAVSTNPGEFTILSLGATSLAPGSTTSLVIRFSPSTVGLRTSTLVVSSNAPAGKSAYTVSLSGIGNNTPLVTTTTIASPQPSGTASLLGAVTARSDSATGIFRYRRVLGVGSYTAWVTATGTTPATTSGFTAVSIQKSITGLVAGLYEFQAGAYNASTGGISTPVYGASKFFSSPP